MFIFIQGPNRFEHYERIYKGSFGRVFKALDSKTKTYVAIKIFDLRDTEEYDEMLESIQNEIIMLSMVQDCKNIVNYKGTFQYQPKLLIVTELLSGGSILDLVRKKKYISNLNCNNFIVARYQEWVPLQKITAPLYCASC